MISTEVDFTLELPPSRVPRSNGVHVSGIIRAIATEQGILRPEWADDLALTDARTITDPVAILRMCIGLAWEEWYINQVLTPLMGVLDHPGENEVDGVYMTHDGESVSAILSDKDRPHLTIHEVKATYKSTRTVGDLTSQWMWITQVMAYCKARRTRFAMVHVLFLCGDYKYPIRPIMRVWQIEFTQEEIDRNWDLLVDYMKERLALERA